MKWARLRYATGDSDRTTLRPAFDCHLKLEFHGSRVRSDAGLLAYRELDDALGLFAMADAALADSRSVKNGWHGSVGLHRQSAYGRLAGYEDVNDADRLGCDPAMCWFVGGKAVEHGEQWRYKHSYLVYTPNQRTTLSGHATPTYAAWLVRVAIQEIPT